MDTISQQGETQADAVKRIKDAAVKCGYTVTDEVLENGDVRLIILSIWEKTNANVDD